MSDPLFEHDCEKCTFLGLFIQDNQEYDLYVCLTPDLPGSSVIGRYGNEPNHYQSMLEKFVPEFEECACLLEAKRRAVKKGLL